MNGTALNSSPPSPLAKQDALPVVTALYRVDFTPSRWEGRTQDGRFLFISYLNGELLCEIAPNEEEWYLDNSETLYSRWLGHRGDQVMSDRTMRHNLQGVLVFRTVQTTVTD